VSPRAWRIVAFVAVLVLAVGVSVGYVLYGCNTQQQHESAAPPVASRPDLASVEAVPHLVFRNTAVGADYGLVAAVPLSDPSGPRAFTAATCDRVYATSTTGLCLAADRGVLTTFSSRLLDSSWNPTHDLPISGIPSRARLSRDGQLAATTNFVYGDSYSNPGQFSTRTYISDATGKTAGELEDFDLEVDGKQVNASDRNVWGVTFADDDLFYATAASGGTTWLVRGSLSARTLTSIRTDVECPSLSPDKTRIAFKKHGKLPPGRWRLAIYDLRTGKETLLAETRSVDDQVEWLDNTHVIYGLPRAASGTASSDVWVTPSDGTGTPRVLIADAWSPAVVDPSRS